MLGIWWLVRLLCCGKPSLADTVGSLQVTFQSWKCRDCTASAYVADIAKTNQPTVHPFAIWKFWWTWSNVDLFHWDSLLFVLQLCYTRLVSRRSRSATRNSTCVRRNLNRRSRGTRFQWGTCCCWGIECQSWKIRCWCSWSGSGNSWCSFSWWCVCEFHWRQGQLSLRWRLNLAWQSNAGALAWDSVFTGVL